MFIPGLIDIEVLKLHKAVDIFSPKTLMQKNGQAYKV